MNRRKVGRSMKVYLMNRRKVDRNVKVIVMRRRTVVRSMTVILKKTRKIDMSMKVIVMKGWKTLRSMRITGGRGRKADRIVLKMKSYLCISEHQWVKCKNWRRERLPPSLLESSSRYCPHHSRHCRDTSEG